MSISRVQFQPYLAGWVTSPFRLAPNTAAVTTASTAATDPTMVARTGAARPAPPRSSAARIPTTALAGRPAAAAARATDEVRRGTALAVGRADRQASAARIPRQSNASTAPPPARTSGSARKPRAGSNARTGPTGASGETATATATASTIPPRTATAPSMLVVNATWARVAPTARRAGTLAADQLSSCARPCPASTSRASAASPPKMASATACGSIVCCTWW